MNETQNNEPKARKKRYDENFKRNAVEHWLASGKSARLVSQELGVSTQTLLTWKQQLALPMPEGQSQTFEQVLEENRRLRRENVSLIRQREILKKTLGILSTPPDNASNG